MKSRTARLVLSTAFVTISLFAFMASLGYFYGQFRWDFYIYFTNISNYLCMGLMLAEWIYNLRHKEDGYVTLLPFLRYMALVGIMLTFLIFNLLLVESPREYLKFDCLTLHVVLPLLYLADWLLFTRHGRLKVTDPLKVFFYPLIYAIFIYLHAYLYHFDSSILNYPKTRPFIYPYFFLDLDELGVLGVLKWILILCLVVVGLGYVFFGIDWLLGKLPWQEGEASQKEAS